MFFHYEVMGPRVALGYTFFLSDTHLILRMANGFFCIDVVTLCERLGLSWRREKRRLFKDFGDFVYERQSGPGEETKRPPRPLLRLSELQRWLEEVDTEKLEPWSEMKLALYREQFVASIWEAFPAVLPEDYVGALAEGLTGDEVAAQMGVPPDVLEAIAAKLGIIDDPEFGRWSTELAP